MAKIRLKKALLFNFIVIYIIGGEHAGMIGWVPIPFFIMLSQKANNE